MSRNSDKSFVLAGGEGLLFSAQASVALLIRISSSGFDGCLDCTPLFRYLGDPEGKVDTQ